MNKETQSELIPTVPGDVLRHKRQKQGSTLEEAARGAKIRLEHLAAIESGETQHIPQVYLNGYIRTYARYLGLAQSEIDQHLPHAKGSEPGVQSVFSISLPKRSDDRWFKATSYVLASVVVIALVWQFTAEAVRFSQGDPIIKTAGVENGSQSSQPVSDATGENQKPSSKRSSTSHLQASIAPLEEVQRARREISRAGAEGAWSAISKASDEVPAEALKDGEQSFRINTSADSWVEIIDGNGKTVEMDLLRAGTGRSYVAQAPVKILLGRASSIELLHEDTVVDLAPYTRGNVARITLSGAAAAEIQVQPITAETGAENAESTEPGNNEPVQPGNSPNPDIQG